MEDIKKKPLEYKDLHLNYKKVFKEMVNGGPFRSSKDISTAVDIREETILKMLSNKEFVDMIITARSVLGQEPAKDD